MRQVPPLKGGPERATVRPPHAQHVDWKALYPTEIILHGPATRKDVAFTFDDGPDDVWTPRIQAVLDTHGVKGTFMCVGERIQLHPQILLQLVRNGHVVGNHSWNHPNFTRIPMAEVRNQIHRTTDVIQNLTGARSRLFRPPYGALNRAVIDTVIALDYKILFWDVDSLDWSRITAEQVSINVLAHAAPGSIILMHSAGGRGERLDDTVRALPYIIRVLRREGFSFRTIPELVDVPAYL